MSDNQVKIDISQLSQFQIDSLCRATLDACKRFYSDPKNVERYEKWKAEKDKSNKEN